MNSIFGQLDQSFKAVWVSNRGSVGRGVELDKLGPEQIAIFGADDYCNKDLPVSLANANFKTNKRLVLKQGIHPFVGQNNVFATRQDKRSRTSIEFTKDDIVSWTGIKAVKGAHTEQVAIGYDGLDASRSLNEILDAKPMHVNIRLSGEPIKRFFHRNFIDHRFVIDKELCLGSCDCFDACGKVPCDLIADGIIKHFNEQELFVPVRGGGQGLSGSSFLKAPLRQFVKANKIKKCTTPDTPPTLTEMVKYEIEICDDGATTIPQLYAQYPNKKIILESRYDGKSVYSFWQEATDPAPADFTMSTHVMPVCDVCPSCPTTYTEEAGLKVVQIRVACGATAPAIPGEVSSEKISTSLQGGDVYIKKTPKSTTDADIEAVFVDCMDGEIIGEEGKACVGSEVTFSWTTCENCFKTTKKYMIVLPDLDCKQNQSRLAELQAAYPGLVIADLATGECIHSYETTVESNCVPEEDCGKLVTYEFQAPAGYDGALWTEHKTPVTDPDCSEPVEETPPCCVCGVVLETAVWDRTYSECTYGWYNWHPNDAKPVRIQVNIHSLDYSNNPCDETHNYSTRLRKLSMDLGTTGELVQEYERQFLMYENKFWSSNPFVNEVDGFRVNARPHVFYDQYVLRLKKKGTYGESHMLKYQDTIDYIFYVEEGYGKDLENLINELVLSADNPDLKAVSIAATPQP